VKKVFSVRKMAFSVIKRKRKQKRKIMVSPIPPSLYKEKNKRETKKRAYAREKKDFFDFL